MDEPKDDLTIKLLTLLDKTEWSEGEKQWLREYIENSNTAQLFDILHEQFLEDKSRPAHQHTLLSKSMLQDIHQKIGIEVPANKSLLIRRWIQRTAVAASLMGLIFLGIYAWLNKDTKNEIAKTERTDKVHQNDVPPGGKKAILTLADGSTVLLDDALTNTSIQQGSSRMIKVNGKVAYYSTNADSKEVLFNTISTPKGGRYQIILPDGSHVWLNAASSLRFPTAFVGKERRVEIIGEAYFEVAKNQAMPFIVKVENAEVQVLGTHFNIMAYKEEAAIKTTLLEGAVKMVSGQTANILKPGQQSQLTKDGQMKIVSNVDMDNVIAWKKGVFHFKNASIETVMRELSRWYDVDVVYNSKIKDGFYAEIPSQVNLSEVLKVLQLTGKVKFKIKDRKVIVQK